MKERSCCNQAVHGRARVGHMKRCAALCNGCIYRQWKLESDPKKQLGSDSN